MPEIEDLENHLADLILQREEIHLADLKRQREAIEPSTSDKPVCPECNRTKKTEEKTDEDCPECRVAVGVGMYLNICREGLDSEENCMDLFEKVDSGEITPDEFFNIIKEKAKDDPETRDILKYTDELMYSEDVDTK